MNLQDCFSDEQREFFAKQNVDLGTAILVKIPSFTVNYAKYAIILAKNTKDVAMVVINSEVNPNVNWNTTLISQHILIPVSDHPFLDYDSYVDCTALREMPLLDVISFIKNNPDKVFNVSDSVCAQLIKAVTESIFISNAEKRKYKFI
ncbi:hypothetical protein G4D82_13990 [Flavobacterium sp. CYK-4]|uniref:hypothetical protein n=1 Tax=Flavobacterium lotistagni TaxID=2709660 RepID=UPI00140BDDE0|nr:hypothetical protein [Flavobacterium lotistagni]NHM08335.1 hypothetical protein [Flavobacterium lotistagni]